MNVFPIKTHPIKQGESIESLLERYVSVLEEGSVLAITSKVISLCESRVVPKSSGVQKEALVLQECEAILKGPSPHNICLTLTKGLLIPSAGIDESNSQDHYILYPKDPQKWATFIWDVLRTRHKISKLGVIITDSHTTPLRRGVTGIALAWCGFSPLYSYIGKPDVFGKPLSVTQINILDALATSAVFVMGEGNEQTPFALIKQAPKMEFLDRPPLLDEINSIKIPLSEDLYGPLLNSDQWEWIK